MRRAFYYVAAVLFLLPASAAAQSSTPAAARTLDVTVTYKGSGTVDATHEIWVFLFDSPQITAQSVPVAVETLTKNGTVATFKEVAADPVYVLVVFDEAGDYKGREGPPPAGTPIAMYSVDEAAPSPVKPGANASVRITFDDSRRMVR